MHPKGGVDSAMFTAIKRKELTLDDVLDHAEIADVNASWFVAAEHNARTDADRRRAEQERDRDG